MSVTKLFSFKKVWFAAIFVFQHVLQVITAIKDYTPSVSLKMLCLYLYTCMLGHNFCSMLNTLNEITLQRELQICMTNIKHVNVLDHKVKTQQQNKKERMKNLVRAEIEPGNSDTAVWCITFRPLWHLRLWIVVKLFNCLDVMGRNKQSQICDPHVSNKWSVFFYNILTSMDTYI